MITVEPLFNALFHLIKRPLNISDIQVATDVNVIKSNLKKRNLDHTIEAFTTMQS